MAPFARMLLLLCGLAVASTVDATFDDYKCYRLSHCHAQAGLRNCGWCYDAHHPNKGYGIPCKMDGKRGCHPVKPCSGEYIWRDEKLGAYGGKCAKHAVRDYESCWKLDYCWDQVGKESCGWCYVKDHPSTGWGLPCYKTKDGSSCTPVAYCPGEYYWKDEDLHTYSEKCSHACWNLETCASQSGIKGCGWCQYKGKGYGIPCRLGKGGRVCKPVKACAGTYLWQDSRLHKFPWCK